MNAIAQASAAPITGPKLDSRRVLAALVDVAIVAAGGVVILFAADALSSDRSEVRGALGAVILGWALYYYFALESGGGQTVGKRLMKLRVVRADGRPAGMREIAVRTVLRVVDGVVGLIVMLATGQRRQRLGDLAAGTIVVDASAAASVPSAPAPPAEDVLVEDAPEAEAAPETGTSTITLPSRPAPPATLADLAAPATPPVPEMRPFDPPAAEPVVEDEVVEDEVVEDEPVAEYEPPAEDEPVVETVEAEPVVEDEPLSEPVVEAEVVEDEPVADYEPPAEVAPVAEVEVVEVEPVAEVEVVEVEPVAEVEVVEVEPVAAAEVVEDEPVAQVEPMTVKSVETVSAIDLVMGGASEEDGSSDEDPGFEGPAAS